jgi:hypothetical protein
VLQSEGVGSLDRKAECSGPNLSWGDTEGSRDTEQDGVVVVLGETVVHEESTRACVNVGPWVADLSGFCKFLGNDFVVGLHKFNQVVVLDKLLSEFEFANETRVSLSQDCVAVTWNDLA